MMLSKSGGRMNGNPVIQTNAGSKVSLMLVGTAQISNGELSSKGRVVL